MKQAAEAAKSLLSGYPDYGKEPPQYTATLADALSYLSDDELAILMHPRLGVRTVCKFLPTIADIHDFLTKHREKQEQFRPAHTTHKELFRYAVDEKTGRAKVDPSPRVRYRPFPKLYDAFSDEPKLFDDKNFFTLAKASKALAMEGKDAARKLLEGPMLKDDIKVKI